MDAKVNHARVEFSAIPGNLGFARVAAASFAAGLGFTVEELEDIKLAISEAVSNCIVHAYPESNGAVGMVWMSMTTCEFCFTISVQDRGVGIPDITAARTPGMTTDSQRLGMGFTLMEALAEHLDVTSEPGVGTDVTMTFSPRQGA